MEGAGLMLNQALAGSITEGQVAKALDALHAKQPQIDAMRREGKWVVASIVMDEPRSVDLLRNVVTTADQLSMFSGINLRWGMTKAEALSPPARLEARPADTGPDVMPKPPPETRRYRSYDLEPYAPIPKAPRTSISAAGIRDPRLASRFLTVVEQLRDPRVDASGKTPSVLRAQLVPYDLDNPQVLDDLAVMIAMMHLEGEDLNTVIAAFGPRVLRSGSQMRADGRLQLPPVTLPH
jgi:hypothetical protein